MKIKCKKKKTENLYVSGVGDGLVVGRTAMRRVKAWGFFHLTSKNFDYILFD